MKKFVYVWDAITGRSGLEEVDLGASSSLLKHTATIAPADLQTIGDTPYEIVPAVTGKLIVVSFVVSELVFVSVPYTLDDTLWLINGNANAYIKGASSMLTVLEATDDSTQYGFDPSPSAPSGGFAPDDVNQPVQLTTDNGTNPADGDSSLVLTTFYVLI